MEFDPTQGAPEGQPESQPASAPEAPAEPEFVDLKNREETWRVPKDLFTQFADHIGWDPNRLKDAIEIGSDGRQLYGRIDEERERLAEEARQLQAIRQQFEQVRQQPQAPQYPQQYRQQYQPAPEFRPVPQRPSAQDVTGNVLWAADMLERIAPVLERIPEIERSQQYINQSIRQRDEAIETAEERSVAMRAYQETADAWKKEYGIEPPSQRELEAFLRRFPISDNIDMPWTEVWDKVAWMVKGPAAFRQARRQAVLNSQKPEAEIRVPLNRAGVSAAPPMNGSGINPSQEELDRQFNEMARRLEGR